MRRLKQLIVLLLCFVLVACGTKEVEPSEKETYLDPIHTGDYQVRVPYDTNNSRIIHRARVKPINTSDAAAIGKGSIQYSKSHFSVKDYSQMEGQFLSDKLAGLLSAPDKDYPDGLNISGTFNTGEESVDNINLLADIYEYDWFKNGNVGGMTLTLYLNPTTKTSSGETKKVKLSKEVEDLYILDTMTKLVSFVRTNVPEIGNQQPIYILVFKSSDNHTSSLPGTFIKEAYYEAGSTTSKEVKDIKESWVLFPSKESQENSPVVHDGVVKIKNSLWTFLGEDIKVIGTGFYRDGQLVELDITVGMNAKTYTEALAATQQVNSLISTSFPSNEFSVTITVTNDNGQNFAVLQKLAGSDQVTSILLAK